MAQDSFVATNYSAGAQTAAAGKWFWVVPDGQWRLQSARANAATAPVGAAILIDINRNGTTLFATQANRLTIADGANANTTFRPPADRVLKGGDILSYDIDQIGSGTAGSGLTISLMLVRV